MSEIGPRIAKEIAQKLATNIIHADIDDIIEQQGDDEDLLPSRQNKEQKISTHIKHPYDEKEKIEIIEAYMNEVYPDRLNRFNEILSGTEYNFDYVNGDIRILEKGDQESSEKKQDHTSYIEENAGENTVTYIKKAKNKLAKKDYSEVCENLRHALESMVDEGSKYYEALTELANEGLIQKEQDHTRDYDALYTAYGYNSEVGSHKAKSSYTANQEQAEFALLITEETIYFLLRRLDTAKQDGINLETWNI